MSQPNQPDESTSQLDAQLRQLGSDLRARGSFKETVVSQLAKRAAGAAESERVAAANYSLQTHPLDVSTTAKSGELSMFQKLSLGSIAATVLLMGFLAVSNSVLAKASLADVIQNVRKVTSYQARVKIETQLEKGRTAIKQTSVMYWQSPDSFRMDSQVVMPGRESQSNNVTIRFRDQPGIELNVPNKTFRRLPAAAGARSPVMALEQLVRFNGGSAKDLGNKRIGDSDCYGFSIPLNEVDENLLDGSLTVWVDKNTDLPIEIHMEVFPGVNMITDGFEWNKEFDKSLFDATPPSGFTENKSRAKPTPDDAMAERIVESLRLYAKHNGGDYPQVSVIYGDVIGARLRKLSGLGGPPYTKEVLASEEFQEVAEHSEGFAHMTVLMRDTSDAQYFGKTVGPTDQDEVLFRWKRADGRMQLIYGDLHTAAQ